MEKLNLLLFSLLWTWMGHVYSVAETDFHPQNTKPANLTTKYNGCECKEDKEDLEDDIDDVSTEFVNDVFVHSEVTMKCCANKFLSGIDFNVTWSFKSSRSPTVEQSFPLSDFDEDCDGQSITNLKIEASREGNYTCTVRGANSLVFQNIIILRVHGNVKPNYGDRISFNSYSNNVYAARKKSVNLTCSFYLQDQEETGPNPDVRWMKIFRNSTSYSEVWASELPDVNHTLVKSRNGTYFTVLNLKNISEDHFGDYTCQIVTQSNVTYRNMSILNKPHPKEVIERRYEVTSSCVVVLILGLIVSLFVIYRLRMDLRLKLRMINKKAKVSGKSLNGYSHDIFIVSDPSAAYWVYTVLLSRLEGEWLYDCYLPDRDMLAGQAFDEETCRQIRQSKRTIIVVTECLLRNSWCHFLMNQAVHNSLASSSKVLAINMMGDKPFSSIPSEAHDILGVLKYIRKLQCPQEFISQIFISDEFEEEIGEPTHATSASIAGLSQVVPKDVLQWQNDAKECPVETNLMRQNAPTTLTIPNTISHSSSSPFLTTLSPSLVPPPSASLSNLKQENIDELDWKTWKYQSQRVKNMIAGNSEFQEHEFQGKEQQNEIQYPTNDRRISSKNTKGIDFQIPFPKYTRKKFYSESSECPISPCSNAPFFGEEKVQWSNGKIFKSSLKLFFYGDPVDLFWKKLYLHLPARPLSVMEKADQVVDPLIIND